MGLNTSANALGVSGINWSMSMTLTGAYHFCYKEIFDPNIGSHMEGKERRTKTWYGKGQGTREREGIAASYVRVLFTTGNQSAIPCGPSTRESDPGFRGALEHTCVRPLREKRWSIFTSYVLPSLRVKRCTRT